MPTITIQGTPIDFPNTGQDPNWAPAVIAFAEAVAAALQGVAGAFDVSPQIFTLDSYNPGVNINIPLLSFPVSNVRSVKIDYSLLRSTSLVTSYDAGTIEMVYSPANPVGNKWEVTRVGTSVDGGSIVFNVTDSGVVQFTTTTLSGINHQGKLSYTAKALQYA